MFWKSLTGQRITLEDIMEVDYRFLRSQEQMLFVDKDSYEQNMTWTTQLPDGSKLDLTEENDGVVPNVKHEERYEFIRQALMARLE